MRFFNIFCASLVALLIFFGCSSGGGGGSAATEAATLSISISPRIIDAGDTTEIRVDITSLDEDGIALKIRYPTGLSYVLDSSFIEVGDALLDAGPDFDETSTDFNYLVYFLSWADFDGTDTGALIFRLRGESAVDSGFVAADADLDDPLTDNEDEFDVDAPQFTEQVSVEVRVENDESSSSSSSSSGTTRFFE